MTFIQKAITALKDYLRAFVKRKDHGDPVDWAWVNDPFYTEENRRNEKLASLARYIESLSKLEQKAVRQKKNVNRYRNAMKAAMNERLGIEMGSIVWSPEFGAWVQKEKA